MTTNVIRNSGFFGTRSSSSRGRFYLLSSGGYVLVADDALGKEWQMMGQAEEWQ